MESIAHSGRGLLATSVQLVIAEQVVASLGPGNPNHFSQLAVWYFSELEKIVGRAKAPGHAVGEDLFRN
jgi:hypothetical protein